MSRTQPIAYPLDATVPAILVSGPGTVVRHQPTASAGYWLQQKHLVWCAATKRPIAMVAAPNGQKEPCLIVEPAPGVGAVGTRPVGIEEYRNTYADELATITWAISELNKNARAHFGPGVPQITLGGLEDTSGVRRARSNSAP